MNSFARAGRAYWRWNVDGWKAIKALVDRDPSSALSVAAFVWVLALLAMGLQVAAFAIAAGILIVQLVRLAVGW